MKHSRRSFIKASLFTAAACCSLSLLSADKDPKKPQAPRPPGSCGGYSDKNRNGVCDRSEQGAKPCPSTKCPAGKMNPQWEAAKAKGAPAGSCAIWSDDKKLGYCEICDREQSPCLYEPCPSHKRNAARKTRPS